jgi:hypothetical protein
MSYGTLMEAVQSVLLARRRSLAPTVITTLEHYAALIGRHIVTDSGIAMLCQQIYRKHKDALDLIFEHRPDLQLDVKGILEGKLTSIRTTRWTTARRALFGFYPWHGTATLEKRRARAGHRRVASSYLSSVMVRTS